MFGISLTEAIVVAVVTLMVVGPQKLPKMLRTLGEWVTRLRRLTSEVRAQSGIDDVLRAEGIEGGVAELRSMLRGELPLPRPRPGDESPPVDDPYPPAPEWDRWREYPPEGPDAYGALPDDLTDDDRGGADEGTVGATEAPVPGVPPAQGADVQPAGPRAEGLDRPHDAGRLAPGSEGPRPAPGGAGT